MIVVATLARAWGVNNLSHTLRSMATSTGCEEKLCLQEHSGIEFRDGMMAVTAGFLAEIQC